MHEDVMTDMFSLEGRVALVTGASRGLGKAIANAMAAAGAHVVLAARTGDALNENAEAIRSAGGTADVVRLDVTDESAIVDAVAQTIADTGRLDILVNNAGTAHRAPVLEADTAGWDAVVATNLRSCFLLSREAGRPMVEQGWGRIITIASIMSQIARPGVPAYVATKHAVVGLTKALAVELGPRGVTANAIGPGYFRTELTEVLQRDPEFSRMIEARCPAGRWGEAEELGGVAVFLASDAAAYINGHLLIVDGGMTINL
jgi:gluconate 5-dehydrogenase